MPAPSFSGPMPAQLAKALADAREQFTRRLVPQIVEIERLQAALDEPGQLAGAIGRLAAIIHKISGVAATVGFPDLGAQAAALDLQLQRLLRTPRPRVPTGLSAMLERLMDLMEDAAFDG